MGQSFAGVEKFQQNWQIILSQFFGADNVRRTNVQFWKMLVIQGLNGVGCGQRAMRISLWGIKNF